MYGNTAARKCRVGSLLGFNSPPSHQKIPNATAFGIFTSSLTSTVYPGFIGRIVGSVVSHEIHDFIKFVVLFHSALCLHVFCGSVILNSLYRNPDW